MKVRLADKKDIEMIVKLADKWHPFSEEENKRRLKTLGKTLNWEGHKVFVAEDNGEVVGWFDVREYKDWFMLRRSVHIEHIFSKYERRGIGSKILQAIIEYYKDADDMNTVFFYSEGGVDRFFVKNGFHYHTGVHFFIRKIYKRRSQKYIEADIT